VNLRLTVAAAVATVLASIALYPLVDGGTWFWGGVGAAIVIAAVGAATRRRAIPAILCSLAALGAEFLYLNAVFAGRQSWAGLVPTGASAHQLQLLVHQALAEMANDPPPVPAERGITLVTVAGIGLVAVLADVLAVRLHRPALAGLPLLVLFCVPLTTAARPGPVGATLVFCAGMVGYLSLLSADGRHRLRLWGRLIHPWQDAADSGPDIRPLAAAGRRIGSAAVVLALALPLLVPGLKAHRLFPGSGNGKGSGQGAHRISFPQPLDLLNTDLTETRPVTVLSYRTNETLPPYLQVYVLGNLGTNQWTMGAPSQVSTLGNRLLPAPAGLAATTHTIPVREQVTLGANLANRGNVSYLPLPYPARQVKVSGAWKVDGGSLSVFSTTAHLAGLRYSVVADDVNPSPEQLRQAPAPPAAYGSYLYLPDAFRAKKLMHLAHHLTAGLTTAFGRAVALQRWFTAPGHFTYSIRGVSRSQNSSALEQFLFHTRTGYCQQFAFAMAVLARLVGIPSRVVVGYTQGTFSGDHTYQVKTSDAHAWPELYFAGAGWLRFEPTPPDTAGLPGQATATVPPYSTPDASVSASTNPGTSLAQQSNPNSVKSAGHGSKTGLDKLKKTAPGGTGGTAAAARRGAGPIGLAVVVLLAVLLIAPAATRIAGRRWRWWRARDDVSRAHVAWHELRNDLTDHRIPYRASESPRALSRRIAGSLSLAGAEREALDRIARSEERASYAVTPASSARLQADEALVRCALARRCARPARWSARLAPPSALIPVRAGLQHVLDVFSWMELVTTKARRRVPAAARQPGTA